MEEDKTDLFLFVSYVLSFFIVSFSFLLISVETEKMINGISVTSFGAGITFWLFSVIAFIVHIVLSVRRRRFLSKNKINQTEEVKRPGILVFFKNKLAIAVDVILIACIAVCIAVLLVTGGTGFLSYVMVAALLFSVCMHSVFNGKIYTYVFTADRILETHEKKSTKKGKD